MAAGGVDPLLSRFAADAGRVLPLVALWAHGSLALGDFQPGRSDFDLVALLGARITGSQRQELRQMHGTLLREMPLAGKLHCAYVVQDELADPGRSHLNWAHNQLRDRILAPVSRRELSRGGLCLLGPAPATVVPELTDAELARYIRADLRDFYYPATDRADVWREDVWVDLGLLTLARARVTLLEGRLITKREALEVLAALDAPAEVLRDICQRRYETGAPLSESWRDRRGSLARAFVRAGIEEVLVLSPEATGPR
ncbi:MAG TPA: nucleotidyltransferase [Trebonia sp.]